MDNQSYYDAFATNYERRRHHGYHAMIDRMEAEVVLPHARGKSVLEIGCGTGLILGRLAPVSARAVGVDLSPRMLARARSRGLEVQVANAVSLPFADESFDVVVSFKVLPHVEQIEAALREAARVARPGGRLFLEYYNRHSLRHIIRRIRPSEIVGGTVDERQVFVRFESRDEFEGHLPAELQTVKTHGLRVLTVLPWTLGLPVVGRRLQRLEAWASRSPLARYGGFMIVECEKAAR